MDTTQECARLYDGTVAADDYRAMAKVGHDLRQADLQPPAPPAGGLIGHPVRDRLNLPRVHR